MSPVCNGNLLLRGATAQERVWTLSVIAGAVPEAHCHRACSSFVYVQDLLHWQNKPSHDIIFQDIKAKMSDKIILA